MKEVIKVDSEEREILIFQSEDYISEVFFAMTIKGEKNLVLDFLEQINQLGLKDGIYQSTITTYKSPKEIKRESSTIDEKQELCIKINGLCASSIKDSFIESGVLSLFGKDLILEIFSISYEDKFEEHLIFIEDNTDYSRREITVMYNDDSEEEDLYVKTENGFSKEDVSLSGFLII